MLSPLGAFAQDAGPDAAAPPVDPAVEEARRALVVARVGEATITLGAVEDAINIQSPFLRLRYRDPERLQSFARDMIRFELLAEAAERAGMAEDPTVRKTIRQNAVQQLIRLEIDERVTQDSIAEIDIQTYYETHPTEFNQPEMRRASHIVLSDLESAQAALTEAGEADARGFRELARRLSVDNDTKLRGGDLRYFSREGVPPGGADPSVDTRLAEAAFGLENLGDIVSAPVALDEGRYSIVKLTGLRAAEARDLAAASRGIRLKIWRERRQEALDGLVDGLRTRFQPVVHLERMRPIRLNPIGPSERFRGHGHGDEGAPAAERPAATGGAATPSASMAGAAMSEARQAEGQ